MHYEPLGRVLEGRILLRKRSRPLSVHFLEASEDRLPMAGTLPYLREISGNQGETVCCRKAN